MNNILKKICEDKKIEIEILKKNVHSTLLRDLYQIEEIREILKMLL